MPAQSLSVPHKIFLQRNAQHVAIANAIPTLAPALQKALAELLLIRLFDDLQDAISGAAYRLACGTSYVDGTTPNLLTPAARSATSARTLFENHGRARPKYVKWSKATFIKDTVRHVIDASDPFMAACDRHSLRLSEMQVIRNRIAHKNSVSRASYDTVLRRYYGAAPQNVNPGLLLITPRLSPTLLQVYLTTTRIVVRDCVRA